MHLLSVYLYQEVTNSGKVANSLDMRFDIVYKPYMVNSAIFQKFRISHFIYLYITSKTDDIASKNSGHPDVKFINF